MPNGTCECFQPLDDKWEYGADTEIARAISEDINASYSQSQHESTSALCGRCKSLELWRPQCNFSDTPADLKTKSDYCALCSILYRASSGHISTKHTNLNFSRVGSSIACSALLDQPILSLYTLPLFEKALPGIQVGYPSLPEHGSTLSTNIMREWIHSCNRNHSCVSEVDTFLPTRVLYVGDDSQENEESGSVRLVCFARGHNTSGQYLALSHRWGSPKIHRMFRTLKSNIESLKKCIMMADLPRTFQHAVQIARSLGVRYLWIDSLCIVQDDEEDWNHESRLMEQVFSSAYATIAATCADGTEDGFLKRRPRRPCVVMAKGPTPYFICEAIDNFYDDVDQADLNNRGWVLQERALSRRTIHFTERQCYWECGGGVRCETLTRMKKYGNMNATLI